MKYLTLNVFDDFKCVGSECPHTCCAGWSIMVDDNSANRYREVSGEFGEKLRNNMHVSNERTFMHLIDERCAFLTPENLCEIYIKLGEEAMCYTCQTYPRFRKVQGDILFQGLNISCPIVAQKILFEKDLMEFDFGENSVPVPEDSNTDWNLFNTLIRGLTTSVGIMQNRRLNLSQRLCLLLFFNDALQEQLSTNNDYSDLFDTFSSENIEQLLPILDSLPNTHEPKIMLFSFICKNLDKFESPQLTSYVSSSITNNIDSFLDAITTYMNSDTQIMYEQYCVYFLFRYYMNTLTSKEPLKIISLLIYMYVFQLCLSALEVDKQTQTLDEAQQIEVFVTTARTFEHSRDDRKIHQLFDLCKDNNMTDTSYLLTLLA